MMIIRQTYVEDVNKNLKEKEEEHGKLAETLLNLKNEILRLKYQSKHYIVKKPGMFGNSPVEV